MARWYYCIFKLIWIWNINKTIGLLRKPQNILPRSALLTIYKTSIKPHIDYGDIIYDQAYNASFHQKLELLQYNNRFGVPSTLFYKLYNSENPQYLKLWLCY